MKKLIKEWLEIDDIKISPSDLGYVRIGDIDRIVCEVVEKALKEPSDLDMRMKWQGVEGIKSIGCLDNAVDRCVEWRVSMHAKEAISKLTTSDEFIASVVTRINKLQVMRK